MTRVERCCRRWEGVGAEEEAEERRQLLVIAHHLRLVLGLILPPRTRRGRPTVPARSISDQKHNAF